MSTGSQPWRRSRWSVNVCIVLLLGFVGVAFAHSPAAFGLSSNASDNENELGENDFRISDMGPDSDTMFDAEMPAAAYNSLNHEFLVVWAGDDVTDSEQAIYGQRIDAETGQPLGDNDFRISEVFTDPTGITSSAPDVVYNSTANEYLVTWETAFFIDGVLNSQGIYGQRLNAETGALIGEDSFLIDASGSNPARVIPPSSPAVTYNTTNDEYMVVWKGVFDDLSFEVVGQRLDATGIRIGSTRLPISDMGPDQAMDNETFTVEHPDVAYNATDNQYLVVWSGDDNVEPLVDDEFEIFGQRLDDTGAEIGANDFRISDIGPADDTTFSANTPAIVYNDNAEEYLVTWSGGFETFDPDGIDYQIFVQRLNVAGEEIGANDVRISDAGGERMGYIAIDPAVVYNPLDDEYLVAWAVEDVIGWTIEDQQDIFAQRLNGTTGDEVGNNDFLVSDMGPSEPSDIRLDESAYYNAFNPGLAYNSRDGKYLAVWSGDDDTAPLVEGEQEIFGQRLFIP